MKFGYDYKDLFNKLAFFIILDFTGIFILIFFMSIPFTFILVTIISSILFCIIMNIYHNINRLFRLINNMKIVKVKTKRSVKKLVKAYPEYSFRMAPLKR